MSPVRKSCLVLSLGLFALAACSDATGGNRAQVNVTFAAKAPTVLASAAPITVDGGGNSLVINRVQLVLGEIELKSALSAECTGSTEDGCPEVELDPVLVDLPLEGRASLNLGALVPAGTYQEVEFKIDAVNDDHSAEATFIAAHPDFRNVSVRVEGTFNGSPFVFTSPVDAKVESELATPVVVTADSPLNLTISIDVASWFRSGATVLDPRDAANASAIANNIQLSFAAFEDDNRDGVEDHR
jgi:hypothetical protein